MINPANKLYEVSIRKEKRTFFKGTKHGFVRDSLLLLTKDFSRKILVLSCAILSELFNRLINLTFICCNSFIVRVFLSDW